MNDYDFSTLNDKEFENISLDLLSSDRGKRYERFKPGKDAGVDGRFFRDNKKEEIIQCKHYAKTGYSGLISSLKKKNTSGNTEYDKVKILNPEKYIFITSLALSRVNKKEIKKIFNPYIKKDSDIYGQEDLNDLLKTNPNIEENHYKLWISSTTVLKRIFNNAIKGRSEFKIEQIEDQIKLYAITDNHNKALKKLEESHTIIITGEPGIGKSTLADHMALKYIEKGFEFNYIEKIKEGEDVFNKGEKQIFYFDDFLGSNVFEALNSLRGSHIMDFITRVKKDKNKRLILTSRTIILNKGISYSDPLKSKKIDKDEFIIEVKSLKDIDKARILYNHIWHSELSNIYKDEIYKDKRYKEIIGHKNFNPRIISFITEVNVPDETSVKDYWSYILNKLHNPTDIWTQTFDIQSDDFIRNIVILTVFNGNTIKENNLKRSYRVFNKHMDARNPSSLSQEFSSVIKKVVKYFLNRHQWAEKTVDYSLFNPSIADFIIERYSEDEEVLLSVFSSLNTLSSLKVLRSLYVNKKIGKKLFQNILLKLHREIEINDFNVDYLIQLFYMLDFPKDDVKINHFYKIIIEKPTKINLVRECLDTITYLDIDTPILKINSYAFLIMIIKNSSEDIDKINIIIEFIENYKIKNKVVVNTLNILINNYLKSALDGLIYDIGIDDVSFEHDEEGNAYLNDVFDLDIYLNDLIDELYNYEGRDIDKDTIIDIIDIEDKKDSLITAYYDNGIDYHEDDAEYIDDIDDLFQR